MTTCQRVRALVTKESLLFSARCGRKELTKKRPAHKSLRFVPIDCRAKFYEFLFGFVMKMWVTGCYK